MRTSGFAECAVKTAKSNLMWILQGGKLNSVFPKHVRKDQTISSVLLKAIYKNKLVVHQSLLAAHRLAYGLLIKLL